mgnify:CR=1 FL=1
MKVAILGASAKPDRYSYKALKELSEAGHDIFPVNPALEEIEGVKVYSSLRDITDRIDMVTIYMSPERSSMIAEDIVLKNPLRVIFNPGAENKELSEKLIASGVKVLEACTLVMLRTGTF